MRDFFQNKSIRFLTATLAVVVAVAILGAVWNPFVSSGVNFLTRGLFQVSARAAESGGLSSEELLEENKKLREEIADLRAQLVDYYDLKDENARLWKYYNLKKSHSDYELMPASVIRRDASDDFYSFTIDAGTAQGVSEQDPVITENGLVGFVSSVNAAGAHVTTVLSPDLQAGALAKRTKDAGVVSGTATLSDENKTAMSKIDANASLKKGDVIVTSGIGGIYPADLIIGKVSEIKYDDYDATKYAVVEPYEDIRKLSDVVVLTGFKSKGEVSRVSEEKK